MTGVSVQPRDHGRYSFKPHTPPQTTLIAPSTNASAAPEIPAASEEQIVVSSEAASLDEIELAAARGHLAELLKTWRPDQDRRIPQAPELYRVALVADLVDRGATTTEALAGAMRVSYREANYYANAASYLRLVSDSRDEGLAVFTPTPFGRAFVRCDSLTKAAALRRMVRDLPATQAIRTEGVVGLTKRLMSGGLSEATATRRAKAMRSWVDQAEEVGDLIDALDTRCSDALALAAMAKDVADQQRREGYARLVRDASGSTPVRHREENICADCNQALPATGECGIC